MQHRHCGHIEVFSFYRCDMEQTTDFDFFYRLAKSFDPPVQKTQSNPEVPRKKDAAPVNKKYDRIRGAGGRLRGDRDRRRETGHAESRGESRAAVTRAARGERRGGVPEREIYLFSRSDSPIRLLSDFSSVSEAQN
jgi:hypothetical protein